MTEGVRRLLWVVGPTLLIGAIVSITLASVVPYEAGAESGANGTLTDEESKAQKDYLLEVVRNADNPDRMREPEE